MKGYIEFEKYKYVSGENIWKEMGSHLTILEIMSWGEINRHLGDGTDNFESVLIEKNYVVIWSGSKLLKLPSLELFRV